MKILILDIYKSANYRISKDTSGGYGTGNDFGDTFAAIYLKKKLKKIHDWPPLFAAYTYSVLKKNNEVEYKKYLPKDIKKYDLFIIVSSIVCCEDEIETIKKIKNENKNIFAIGPFATSNPKMYNDAGASVISGEPEFYFLNNNDFDNDLKKDIVLFHNISNIDDLPFPDWEDLVGKNKNASSLFGGRSSVPILGTRGCPYSCFKYCVYPLQQGRKVRQRTPKKIVDEMEIWKNKGVNMFIFRDPVFSINKKHTIEFCKELVQRDLKIRFVIETHLRILDTELIKKLKEAGLKGVKVGVESYDENVLQESGRFTVTKDEQLNKIRELEKNNIQISAMYILGFPTDNDITIKKTIDYAKKLNTTYAQFSIWTPYPGTPVFKEYKDKIVADKFDNFDQYHLVYKHNLFDKKTIRKYLSKAYSVYYLRINWLYKYFKSFLYSK